MTNVRLIDQPHVRRLFRVLYMLQSVRRYTVPEISESVGISARTVYRYIEEFRNSGFEIIQESGGYYRLSLENRRNKTIIDIMSETTEWQTINNMLEFSTAIKTGKRVKMLGYASGHSSTIKDREVEPFEMTKNKKYVWCYDPKERYCKVFRPSRCKNVLALEKDWQNQDKFLSESIDIFGFHGKKAVRVKILLDIMAHNLLLEENGEAKLEMTETEGKRWLLDTRVFDIQGVGRFCMGLIGHFEIVEAPELKEYIQNKCSEAVKLYDLKK